MTVIVTGSRSYRRGRTIQRVIESVMPDEIIEGGEDGADRYARASGHVRGCDVVTVWANWKKHGRAAGPIRNSKMLKLLLQHVERRVLAFPLDGSIGTWDMVRKADREGVRVTVYDEDGHEVPRERWRIKQQ